MSQGYLISIPSPISKNPPIPWTQEEAVAFLKRVAEIAIEEEARNKK